MVRHVEEQKQYEFTDGPHQQMSEYVQVELFIGGRENVSVAVPLILTTTTSELKQLIPLVNRIEQIHVRSHDFKLDGYQQEEVNQRLENLTSYLHQLMNLGSLHNQKNEIQDATCLFFEMTLTTLESDPIPPGTPGYDTYLEQCKILSNAIQNVRKALESNDIHVNNTLKSLINPITVHLQSFKNLPQNLVDFDLSLDDASKWVNFMRGFHNDIGRFNQYALLIQAEIFSLPHDSRPDLFKRIKSVAGILRSHGLDKMLANAFEDIALGAASPVRLQRVNTICQERKLKYDTKLDSLKAQINLLTKTKEFSKNYLAFRQSLTSKMVQYPSHKQEILEELQQHLRGFDKSQKNTSIVVIYIDACIQRIHERLPEHLATAYAELMSGYETKKTKTTKQQLRLNFLNKWMDQIEVSPEKTYGECYDVAKRNVDPATCDILEEKRHRFFNKRQHFKAFSHDLLAEDAYLISSGISGPN